MKRISLIIIVAILLSLYLYNTPSASPYDPVSLTSPVSPVYLPIVIRESRIVVE